MELVSLADVEISLEGFGRPPTEALNIVFKDTIVSRVLCCSAAGTVAGVAFIILVAVVLKALPHLVDVFVTREGAILCSE